MRSARVLCTLRGPGLSSEGVGVPSQDSVACTGCAPSAASRGVKHCQWRSCAEGPATGAAARSNQRARVRPCRMVHASRVATNQRGVRVKAPQQSVWRRRPRPACPAAWPGAHCSAAARSWSWRWRSTRPPASRLRHLSFRSTCKQRMRPAGLRQPGRGMRMARARAVRPRTRTRAAGATYAALRPGLTVVRFSRTSPEASSTAFQLPGPSCSAGVQHRGTRTAVAGRRHTRPTCGLRG